MQARAFMRASLTMRRRAAKSNRGAGFAIHHARWRNPRMRENMEPVMEEKSESIRRLVSRLRLDDRGWVVVEPDPWEADLMAIGVSTTAEPRRIVYLSTYRLKGSPEKASMIQRLMAEKMKIRKMRNELASEQVKNTRPVTTIK